MMERRYKSKETTVSVPFRGSVFLNNLSGLIAIATSKEVSVPFRGSVFLNKIWRQNCGLEVSVPFRGSVFLNVYDNP